MRAAIVTGGSRGIGLAITRRLAADGYAVTITGRDRAGLERAAAQVRDELGTPVVGVPADLADEAAVDALVPAHLERFGRLDHLVLNAGMGKGSPIAETPLRRLDLHYAVNLRSTFALVSQAIPPLRRAAEEHGSARVVAIASMTALVAEAGLAAYGATKAAIVSLCEALTQEEYAAGVLATAICPGYVDTDMAAWKHDAVPADEMIRPDDVAELAMSVLRLSRTAVVPTLAVVRPGPELWRA
ncbi:SDR family NAD(P)-dependent oxidoreductase [Agromyces sp. SYSU T00194]|uniref:SDR family NAD(P)-dependent oxidoreductase n=1 Tax=Agromyces chitinivorans TaxID=3158560 RepID=UPI0033909FA1